MNTTLHINKAVELDTEIERTIRPYEGTNKKALAALRNEYAALVAADAARMTVDEVKVERAALKPVTRAAHNYLCSVHARIKRNATGKASQ